MKAMVVGLGRVGFEYSQIRHLEDSHWGAYMMKPDIDTVIGVDLDDERLRKAEAWVNSASFQTSPFASPKRVIFEKDYVEAVEAHKPEIASVCVPTPGHYDVMKDLCHKDGPEVICLEKPVASSLEEANKIANRTAYIYGLTEKKPRVAVNLSRRWHPTFRKVKEILGKGEIGKPLLAIGHHPGPLLRSGIHMLDLFNWYFGEVECGRSHTISDSWMTKKMPETDDVAISGEFIFKNGTRVLFLASELAEVDYQHFELEIFGEKGGITVLDNGVDLVMRDINTDFTNYGGLKGLRFLYNPEEYPLGLGAKPMVAMVDDLVQCVQNPKRQPLCNLEDGIQAQIMVHMLRQSKFELIHPDNVNSNEVIKSH